MILMSYYEKNLKISGYYCKKHKYVRVLYRLLVALALVVVRLCEPKPHVHIIS